MRQQETLCTGQELDVGLSELDLASGFSPGYISSPKPSFQASA